MNQDNEPDPNEESVDLDFEPVSQELKGKEAMRIRNIKKVFNVKDKEPVVAVDGKYFISCVQGDKRGQEFSF